MTREITSEEFKDMILDYSQTEPEFKSEKPVVVDFHAEWCGPCKMLSPVLEQLAEENQDVQIYKVNVDNEHEVAAKFGVRSIPTLLFASKEKSEVFVGAPPKSLLENKIKELIG